MSCISRVGERHRSYLGRPDPDLLKPGLPVPPDQNGMFYGGMATPSIGSTEPRHRCTFGWSRGFEITDEDVFHVLRRHALASDIDDAIVSQTYDRLIRRHGWNITRAALRYDDLTDQTIGVLLEIEAVLIDDGLIIERTLLPYKIPSFS